MKNIQLKIDGCDIYSEDMPLKKLLSTDCDIVIVENSIDGEMVFHPEDFEDCKTWKQFISKCIKEYKVTPTQIEVYPNEVRELGLL